jgi:hypothetical protein
LANRRPGEVVLPAARSSIAIPRKLDPHHLVGLVLGGADAVREGAEARGDCPAAQAWGKVVSSTRWRT